MSIAPEGTVGNPVAQEVVEGGNGHDKEEIEVRDLRTCRPKPNGRLFVWTQRLFLLDARKRVVYTVLALAPNQHQQPHRPLRVAKTRQQRRCGNSPFPR